MNNYFGLRVLTYFCIIFNVYSDIAKKLKLAENIMNCDCPSQSLSGETKAWDPPGRLAGPSKTPQSEIREPVEGSEDVQSWRRNCGCIRTSDKLKQILKSFPCAPPPSPASAGSEKNYQNTCITTAYCAHDAITNLQLQNKLPKDYPQNDVADIEKPVKSAGRCWLVVSELVQVVQLSMTATALALYYFIYCYMQLIYFTLRSALYFHHADGPMKVTIAVVSLTSLVVGFNLLQRMERLFGLDAVVRQI